MFNAALLLTLAAVAGITSPALALAAGKPAIEGTVTDALGRPLGNVNLELRSSTDKILARSATDAQGRFRFANVPGNSYIVVARKRGFKTASVVIPGAKPVALALESEQPLNVAITASLNQARNSLSPETGSTVYRFTDKNISLLPQGNNTPLNGVLIQAPGVTQDSYGQGQSQIHIHGLNGGGIQYRLNGVFLPEPVSSFGQLFSSYFIKSVTLIDNFMPAQFGYRNEGVVDIHSKDGCLSPGGQLEYYGGQRGTIQPSLQFGGCPANVNYYLSGFYFQSALGVQSPTQTPTPEHDRTSQGQGFGYASYLLSPNSRLSLITGTAINAYQIPGQPDLPVAFPISGVVNYPNSANTSTTELEQNYFGILALQGSSGPKLNYQIALFSRYYNLMYNPDPIGDLAYNGIADKVLHTGFVNGMQEDTSYRLNQEHTIEAGYYISGETLEEDNHALVFPVNSEGMPGTVPETVIDDFNGKALLLGIYAQDRLHPLPNLELILGARYDIMNYFGWQKQFSPRLGLVYSLRPSTTLNAGYARYFQVPPFESALVNTVSKFAGTTGASNIQSGDDEIKAEDDEFFDAGIGQQLPFGLSATAEGWFLWATNKLDLAQFGKTYIFAPLQYEHGRGWGADFSLVKSTQRLSFYYNFSYAVQQANNVTGGQLLIDDPTELDYIARHWVYLDDDQEFTWSAGLTYQRWGFLLSADAIWGNGYRFGFANQETQHPYLQVNAAVGHRLPIPQLGEVEGRLCILNLFDHVYLIRQGSGIGVFSPQYGPRRALYFSATLPFGSARTGTGP
ncbi:MAG: TonB-dependent receptor [Deltaproteobacteria bacterium]|nr:TonB-dependent receptor [Deltaproteobacteria bacterium]